MRRAFATLALAECGLLAACGNGDVSIPLEIQPGKIAIAVSTVDDRFTVTRLRYSAEELSVPSDDGEPIYTWIITPADFVRPNGTELVESDFDSAVVRVTKGRKDPLGDTGICGRCLIPSNQAPQIVSDGDSCGMPHFAKGAMWEPSEDGDYRCASAPGGRQCAEGDLQSTQFIEEIRLLLRFDWPGACACNVTPTIPLRNLAIKPVTPRAAANPLGLFAQRADGLIAGFGQGLGLTFDPATGETRETRLKKRDVDMRYVTALRSGDFLVTSEIYNTGYTPVLRYELFSVNAGVISEPVTIDSQTLVRPLGLKYLDGDPAVPLYLLGEVTGSVGQEMPSIAACDDQLRCQQVTVQRCLDSSRPDGMFDALIMPDGSGIGVADKALFYKAPNAPPIVNPHPGDSWTCWHQPENFEWRPPNPDDPVRLERFQAMGRVGDRVFLCGLAIVAPCEAPHAIVMTATVTAPPDDTPEPEWEVVYGASDHVSCVGFLEKPEAPQEVRLILSHGRVVDFDQNGNVALEGWITDVYEDVPEYNTVVRLGPGSTLILDNENGVHLRQDQDPLRKIYGPVAVEAAHYRAIVDTKDDEFVAFGSPAGPVRVRVLDSTGPDGLPEVEAVVLSDPNGAFQVDDNIRAAVIDGAATRAGSELVILVAGSRQGARSHQPFLSRIWIDGDTVSRGAPLEVPLPLAGLQLIGAAEIADDNFVVIAEGTRILRVSGSGVRELEIDYDDHATELNESKPQLQADACTGQIPRLDALNQIDGGHGAAWVVGQHSLLMRVTANRVERFEVANHINIMAVDAPCPDQVIAGGRGEFLGSGGDVRHVLQFWDLAGLESASSLYEETLPPLFSVDQSVQDEIESLSIVHITGASPIAVFRDASSPDRPNNHPFGAIMTNGYLHRFRSSDPIEYLHVPFEVACVGRSESGYLLFGGSHSHLALGIPERE